MPVFLNNIYRFFSSFRASVALLAVYAILLSVATVIEKIYGTPVAKEFVYYSPLFFLIQLLLIMNFFVYSRNHQYLSIKRPGVCFTHLAFAVIIIGAVTTHFAGEEGLLHIREGETADSMTVTENGVNHIVSLPFSVRLDDFVLERYPGSGSPSSYESYVTVYCDGTSQKAHIYMNNVLDIEGYRLFQSSFDRDERGTVLTVNYDLPGRTITYTGYVILLVGLLFSLFGRHSRVMVLYRKLREMQSVNVLISLFVLLLSSFLQVQASSSGSEYKELIHKYAVNQEHAGVFGSLPLQSPGGRMMPVGTYASEVLRKIHKSDRFEGLTPEQSLLSMFIMPDIWINIPFINIDDRELAERYGLSMPYCAFVEVIDSLGTYKLQADLEGTYRKNPSERNAFDKDLLKLNEQVNLMDMLLNRKAFRLFPLPDDPAHTWYSPGDDLSVFSGKDSMFVSRIFDWYLDEVSSSLKSGDWKTPNEIAGMIDTYQQAKSSGVDISHKRMDMEVKYNRLNTFKYCRMGYLILGGLSLVLSLLSLMGRVRYRTLKTILFVLILGVFLFQMYGMALRWYIAGHAPWSNSYETMVYVAWATVCAGLLFIRRSYLVFSLATIFAGVLLFVSGLNWMDPHITPLVPVLKSPWLMIHVAVIVAAYGFFGLCCLIGLTNMFIMSVSDVKNIERVNELSILNEISMWIGLVLMVAGTFLGAVWANESWGRYWGWDPKETWALITVVVYAIVTHIHLLKCRMELWLFNFLSVLSISTVLMTFFGVNYFLSGMHSYGHSGDISGAIVWVVVAFMAVFILGLYSYIKTHRYIISNNLKKEF